MARLEILEYPDPRLREASDPVTAFDDGLRRLADDLIETLRHAGGIGLSAPQVGASRRVIVVDLAGEGANPEVWVNPEILSRSTIGIVEESCLSIPGVVGNVMRATELRARGRDPSGQAFERDLSGMEAVCVQHEVDHLDGVLFIDRLSFLRKLRIRGHLARARERARRGR